MSAGKPLLGTPWYVRLMGGMIKRMVLSAKPHPRGSRTHPQYEIASAVDFGEQHARLLAAIDALRAAGSSAAASLDPLFGEMTARRPAGRCASTWTIT